MTHELTNLLEEVIYFWIQHGGGFENHQNFAKQKEKIVYLWACRTGLRTGFNWIKWLADGLRSICYCTS